MKHLDLFSGIGGFALAAQWAGFETVAYCEIEPYCQKVLRKNFGQGIVIHDDIRKLDGGKYKAVDLLTGGFPCQPYSIAGKRRGENDPRALWTEMRRIIHEAKPTWVVGENVANFANMGLDAACADLENEGYEVQAFIIPAVAVGAPHTRKRVFIVAHANGREQGRREQPEREENKRDTDTSGNGTEGCFGIVAYADDAGGRSSNRDALHKGWRTRENRGTSIPEATGWKNGSAIGDIEPAGINANARAYRMAQQWQQGNGSENCEGRYRISPNDGGQFWTTEPNVGRVAHGIPSRVDRLKGLGNAVVPQQVYPILKLIAEELC